MCFLQLYHQDLLASLGDVVLIPLEEMDVAGFRICGAQALCQAAWELLQSPRHPGSARFLRSVEDQRLLQAEAQFRCVFGTEHLASATLDIDPREAEVGRALTFFPFPYSRRFPLPVPLPIGGFLLSLTSDPMASPCPPGRSESLATLEVEEEEQCEEQQGQPAPGHLELEEEAAQQLALHRSLEPQGQAAPASLALWLWSHRWQSHKRPWTGRQWQCPVEVHVRLEQDVEDWADTGGFLEGPLEEGTVAS
ncbi:LOW QUALITY PROTEIN: protein mono-ADP-ribosyltransferase PARP10 [Thomomys bottae]